MTDSYQLKDLDASIVVEPTSPANSAVIWLHGLGADGHDFVGLLPQLNLPENHAIRFIFPHAPIQPVTVNGGMTMRSWYDIYSMSIADKMDLSSIAMSSSVVKELIEEQIASGIDVNKIVLAGFSQGGLIVLNTALKENYVLAGVMALSTYYPKACMESLSVLNTQTPILMMHGEYDPVVPINVAQASREGLKKAGCEVEWHEYPMEHQLCMPEIVTISAWLKQCLT